MAKYKIKKESKNGKTSKKLKEQKILNDNELEIRNFIIILIVVIVIVLGLYFISKAIVNKRGKNKASDNNTVVEVDYDLALVGTLLNRPYDDYYVLIYDTKDTNSVYYANLFTKYDAKEDGLKIYYCDLSNPLNEDYVAQDGQSNPYARSIEEFAFGKVTLLRVRYGQIISYLEDIDQIKETLQ